MYNNTASEAHDNNLSCFFTMCEHEFRFLEVDHDFSYFSGLLEYIKGRHVLRPCNPKTIHGQSFDAATIYDNGKQTLEITYNGETSVLDFFVCYNRINRFALAEIISAARWSFPPKTQRLFSPDVETLKTDIAAVAQIAKKNRAMMTDPDPKIIERTLTIREKKMEQQIRAQFRRDTDEARAQAAKAFVAKDYVRVIMLLTPYENYLDSGSAKKLTQARKTLLGK